MKIITLMIIVLDVLPEKEKLEELQLKELTKWFEDDNDEDADDIYHMKCIRRLKASRLKN